MVKKVILSRVDPKIDVDAERSSEVVRMRREIGTLSSINQVDASGKVHGVRVTFYGDGKTIYIWHSFVHGRKQGPAMWYYRNGRATLQFYVNPVESLDRT